MSLPPGANVGPYQILSGIGAGGMVKSRARDSRLNRDVALKVLPEIFASDTDRLARFKREAEIPASLNHPDIAAIYGLEESSGMQALILELVEGPTLADRIDLVRHGYPRLADDRAVAAASSEKRDERACKGVRGTKSPGS
ncbi:MAG TPA: hypothetical protein VFO14_09545 [Vicinamibacterales bacterium]|nr:hypothetical protein [Vicinamibacterales bacterium]